MTSDTLLAVEGASLSFGGIHALQDVRIAVPAGSITAVIGPNGAGKSSLFNVISEKTDPRRDVSGSTAPTSPMCPPISAPGFGIARSFQNIALFRGLTVVDNIKVGAHARLSTGLASAFFYNRRASAEEERLRREIECDVIDFLEIDHIRDEPVGALSYGLQKRVELARALALRPKLLMLDEPVAGMNREETEDMARFILDLQEQRGMTILLIDARSRHGHGHLQPCRRAQFWSAGRERSTRGGARQPGCGQRLYRGRRCRRDEGSGHDGAVASSIFWNSVWSGLALGGLYALIGLGFVLIYKATRVLNFAMGEFMMLGAYLYFTANVLLGLGVARRGPCSRWSARRCRPWRWNVRAAPPRRTAGHRRGHGDDRLGERDLRIRHDDLGGGTRCPCTNPAP